MKNRQRQSPMVHTGLEVGSMIVDMHYGSLVYHKELHRLYEVRNAIEFYPQTKANHPLNNKEKLFTTPASDAFGRFLQSVVYGYLNKMLVVLGAADDEGWVPCAYQYDGRRIGLCEVRKRKVGEE